MELQEGCVKDAKDRETRTKTVRYEGTLDTHIHTAAAAFKWVSTNQQTEAADSNGWRINTRQSTNQQNKRTNGNTAENKSKRFAPQPVENLNLPNFSTTCIYMLIVWQRK